MSRLFQRLVFVLSAVIFTALGLGFAMGEFGWFGVHAGSDQDGAYKQMGIYADVLKKIQTDYVTEPNIGDVTNGALHGLLEALDADSSYLTPTEFKIYSERSTTGGAQIGITVSKRFGYASVVNVTPGSPADAEHLKDGDVIESIDGQSTRELSLAVIRLMLEGKPGTKVTLSLVRPVKSDSDKITLTRAVVIAPSLATQSYENGTILYLKPGVLTAARVDELAAKIKAAPKNKVLLDLRDVTGEDPQQGLRLANLFLKQGTMATLGGQQYTPQTFTADPAKCITDAPVEVLVNHGTYGAPELTAAALMELKRGDVVGERTFGEGSVQKTINLQNGAALLLTVAKFQTPSGKKIQDDAVTPNVKVGNATTEDEDDEAAPAPAPAPKTPSKTDEFLDKALQLLKAKAA
ncbi:MAG: S41 family peptidase [Terracidiphilus sp.]|nr:S41 family peptidase [Terracidiphilus sp.]